MLSKRVALRSTGIVNTMTKRVKVTLIPLIHEYKLPVNGMPRDEFDIEFRRTWPVFRFIELIAITMREVGS